MYQVYTTRTNTHTCLLSMELARAEEFIQKSLEPTGAELSDIERVALEAAWTNVTYEEISQARSVNENTLKCHVAPILWKKLSAILQARITKKTFRSFCEEALEAKPEPNEDSVFEAKPEPSEDSVSDLPLVGAALPRLTDFYGREEELMEVQRLLQLYSCLVIIGVEGIGKKSLIAKLLCTEGLPFSKIIWKPLHHRPTADQLESELLELIGAQKETSIVKALQDDPLLIVLESLDAVISDDRSRKLDDNFASLIRRITEETKTKVVISTIEPIKQLKVQALRGKAAIFTLTGVGLEAARGIVGSDLGGQLETVWQAVGGNPLLLKRVAGWSAYTQGLDPSIANRSTVYRGMFEDVHEHIFKDKRLSTIDRELLVSIAISGKEMPFSDLLNSHPNSATDILRLTEMGLLQKTMRSGEPIIGIHGFFQQYLVRKKQVDLTTQA